LRAVHGAGNLAPVSGDDGGVDDQERGSRVGDRGPGAAGHGLGRRVADGDLRGREFPEAALRVDGHGGQAAGELGRVDNAELIAANRAMFKVRGEDRAAQVGRDVGEEGLLLLGPDGVEFAEGEADEAVGGGIGDEGLGNGGGQPDGLSLLVSISRAFWRGAV
jgi:hypothetical protein